MSSRHFIMVSALSMFFAGAAHAQWTSHINADSKGASAESTTKGKTVTISCAKWAGTKLSVVIYGGPFKGMKNIDDGDDSTMMWIEMPDGRTVRHPIDGHYYAPDKAFVGEFLVSDLILDQVAGGSVMRFTTAQGNKLVELPMKGLAKARQDFRRTCGI
jgi:hypothetical protein